MHVYKKTYLLIVLIFVIVYVLFAVSNIKDKSNGNLDKGSFQGVCMSVIENSITSEGCEVIIQNDTDVNVYYGTYFSIEGRQNGEWITCLFTNGVTPVWEDVEYLLQCGEKKEETIVWKYVYGSLGTGEYRVVKKIYFDNYDDVYISAEFAIP